MLQRLIVAPPELLKMYAALDLVTFALFASHLVAILIALSFFYHVIIFSELVL